MNLDNLIQEETKALIVVLSDYLDQKAHSQIQAHIDRILENWEKLKIEEKTPCIKGEKEFWCTVWATQHLASDDHWSDDVTQSELSLLLNVLKGNSDLPSGYEGKRP